MKPTIAPILQIKQEQKQILAPMQIQSLELLAFSAQELSEYVAQQLLENPLLEVDESQAETASAEPFSEMPPPDYATPELWTQLPQGSSPVDEAFFAPDRDAALAYYDHSLAQLLLLQLPMASFSAAEKAAVQAIIAALDEDGYLRIPLEQLSAHLQLPLDVLESALVNIQALEPAGVGARNLAECLTLQIRSQDAAAELAKLLIRSYLPDLAAGRFARVAKACAVSEEHLKQAYAKIRTLSPRPAVEMAAAEQRQVVVADLILRKIDGSYQVFVNNSLVPPLRVNAYYRMLLQQPGEGQALTGPDANAETYLREQLTAATQLISYISRRKETLRQIAELIVDYQEGFFEHGPCQLKPLTLRQLAQWADLHESTVCRAIGGKYIDTPRGVLPLSLFFSSSIATKSGAALSGMQVRTMIAQLIREEDKQHPLSDRQIEEALLEQGILIARRTVAKYRDAMGIASCAYRKEV